MININTNKLIIEIIPQKVEVRKYEVDIKSLQNILRKSKNYLKLTNKQIAKELNQPLTLVEHWFRTDKSFSIPNKEIWYQLKELLKITTDKFDKSITIFEIKDGKYEKSSRVYNVDGIAPTLTSTSAEFERIVIYG